MSAIIFDEEKAASAMRRAGVDYKPPQIKVVKQSDSVIIPDRKATALKRISDMETELGRMMKLLNEMRADVLHLTVE